MNKTFVILLTFGLIYIGYAGAVVADDEIFEVKGQIKVCRRPDITESKDGKQVNLSADGTYTGAAVKIGGDWTSGRSIVIKPDSAAVLGRKKSDCAIIDATLIQEDGKPVEKGQSLAAQFSIAGFTELATVVKTFKPKKVNNQILN